MAVVAQAFDLRQILVCMSKINWEVKEVMSQHNSYIDMILRVSRLYFFIALFYVLVSFSGSADISFKT